MKINYEPTINLGAVIQFVLLICGGVGLYIALAKADVTHDERIAYNASEIKRVEIQSVDAVKELRDEIKEVNKNLKTIDNSVNRLQGREQERNHTPERISSNVFAKPNTR